MTFGSLQWNDSLNDPESEEFKKLAAMIQDFVSMQTGSFSYNNIFYHCLKHAIWIRPMECLNHC